MINKDTSRRVSSSVSLVAGGAGGAVEAVVTYPLELAKTRIQLGNVTTRNPLTIINHILRIDGLQALYNGFPNVVIGSMGKNAVRFLAFDAIKNVWTDPVTGALTPGRSLLAGMSAGVVTSMLVVTPTQRIKTALIDDAGGTRRLGFSLQAVRVLYREKGLAALYDGLAGTTLKSVSATAVRMGTYNILKDYERARGVEPSAAASFANGSVAGVVTTYATQPFDTLKTRTQSARGATTREAFRSILADGGLRSFWRGSVVRLGRTIISGGILFTVYEQVVAVLSPVLRPM